MKIAVVALSTLLATTGVALAQTTYRDGTVGRAVPPPYAAPYGAPAGSEAGNNANSLHGPNSAANNNTQADSVEGRTGGGGSGGAGGAGGGQ